MKCMALLTDRHLIDDRKYVRSYIDATLKKGKGLKKALIDLKNKDIPEHLIEEEIEKFDESEEDDPCYFLVKKPSKALLTMLGSKEYKDDSEKANNALISNCVLAGDMEMLENDSSVFTGLIEKLINLSNVTKVQLKKV